MLLIVKLVRFLINVQHVIKTFSFKMKQVVHLFAHKIVLNVLLKNVFSARLPTSLVAFQVVNVVLIIAYNAFQKHYVKNVVTDTHYNNLLAV